MESDPIPLIEKHGFEVIREIGKGKYGTCYLVKNEKYEYEFVCKTILVPSDERHDTVIRTFMQETDALTHITHPNILNIYQHFSEGDYLFLILEYCCNGDLLNQLQKGPIPRDTIRKWTFQIISALNECHKLNYAHTDIKPANMLIDKFGRIKVADFGLSYVAEKGGLSNRDYFGSLPYLPPEKLYHKPYDPFKADVWAFGVSLYQILTGHLPFKALTLNDLRKEVILGVQMTSDIPLEFKKIIRECLIVNPEERTTFQSLLESMKGSLNIRQQVSSAALTVKKGMNKSHRRTLGASHSAFFTIRPALPV